MVSVFSVSGFGSVGRFYADQFFSHFPGAFFALGPLELKFSFSFLFSFLLLHGHLGAFWRSLFRLPSTSAYASFTECQALGAHLRLPHNINW